MKKRLVKTLLTAAMILVFLAGCGQSGKPESSDPKEETAAEEEIKPEETAETEEVKEIAKDIEAAVFYYTYEDTYIESVRMTLNGILDELGITYWNFDGNKDQTTQNGQIDIAISQGADILIVNIVTPNSPEAAMEIIDKAKEVDIPVIFFNRGMGETEEREAVLMSYEKSVFVGTNAPEAGHIQGKMIGDYLMRNYSTIDLNGDGIIQYAMFMGEVGNVEAEARTRYSVEDTNELLINVGKPELEYFDASNGDKYQADPKGTWSETAGFSHMADNLIQFNEANGNMIELIICNNDEMAIGVINALNEAGYNLGNSKSTTIPVFGVEAVEAAVRLITEGKMTGTVKQDAGGMAEAIGQLVRNTVEGKELMSSLDHFMTETKKGNKIFIFYEAYTGK